MATTSTSKRFSFTKQAIETLPQTDAQLDFYDTKTPHLTVRVAKRKVFYWYGKVRGRTQRVKLGVFPDLSVENARKFAQRVSANVAEGKPPIEERHDSTTLGKLFSTYLEVWAKPRKKSWQQDKYAYDRHLKHWQHRQLEDITKSDLQRLHATIGTKHGTTTANRLRALLSKMWNVAIEHGHWTGDNPVSAVKKFSEQQRERYLREDELPNFFAQLEADENQDFADYVRLSLFTGGRQANVLAMRWDQLNFDRAEWTIPADQFKSAKMQIIPLSAEALQVLEKRKAAADSEWVFPGNGSTKHLTRPGKWWDALLERCKLSEHLTMHDLRRTLGSWQAAGGTSLLVIGKTLGHKDSRSTEVYARLDLDPVRKSVGEATKAIAAAAANTDDKKDEASTTHSSLAAILESAGAVEAEVKQVLSSLPTALAYTYFTWLVNAETIPAKIANIQSLKEPEKLAIAMYDLGHMIGNIKGEMDEVTTGRQQRQQAKRHLNQMLEEARTHDAIDRIQKAENCSRTEARRRFSESECSYRQVIRRDSKPKLTPEYREALSRLFASEDSRPSMCFLIDMINKYVEENW